MNLRQGHQRELVATRRSSPIAAPVRWTFRRWAVTSLGVILLSWICVWGIPIAWRTLCEQRLQSALYWERWTDAEIWLQRLHSDNVQNTQNDVDQARIQRKQGLVKEAHKSLLRAARRGHSPAELQREEWLIEAQIGNLSAAEGPLLTDLEQGRDSSEIFAVLAEGYLRSGQFAKGDLLLTQWLQTEPRHWKGHFLQAQFFSLLERWRPAAEEFRAALRFHPGHADSEFHLAEALLNLSEAQSALPLLRRSIAHWPDRPLVAVALARALMETGEPSAAVTVLEEWSRRQPHSTTIGVALGRALLACGRFEEVVSLHQQKANRGCADPELRFQLGTALVRCARPVEAEPHLLFAARGHEELEAAIRLRADARQTPGAVATQLELAALLLRYEQESEAFLWLRGIMARDPRHREAHQLLANYYERTAAWDETRRSLAVEHRKIAE